MGAEVGGAWDFSAATSCWASESEGLRTSGGRQKRGGPILSTRRYFSSGVVSSCVVPSYLTVPQAVRESKRTATIRRCTRIRRRRSEKVPSRGLSIPWPWRQSLARSEGNRPGTAPARRSLITERLLAPHRQ